MTTPEAEVERLAALVGWDPPVAAPSVVDWGALEAAVGHPFPADYRRYVEVFPPGDIGVLHVLHPLAHAGPLEYLATIDNYHAAINDRAGHIAGFSHRWGTAPGDLQVWGQVQGDYLLCWRLGPAPPEQWPVVVCDTAVQGEESLAEYPGPAVRLLLDLAESSDLVPPMISYVSDALPYRFATFPVP